MRFIDLRPSRAREEGEIEPLGGTVGAQMDPHQVRQGFGKVAVGQVGQDDYEPVDDRCRFASPIGYRGAAEADRYDPRSGCRKSESGPPAAQFVRVQRASCGHERRSRRAACQSAM
jgi:hypothetical protein